MKNKRLCIWVDVLLFISLAVVMLTPFLIPPFLNPELPGRGMTEFTQFMRETHVFVGYAIAVLILLHIILTWEWIVRTTKNISKVRSLVKFQYLTIVVLLIAIIISIISGIIWDVRGVAPTPPLRAVHAISSWTALVAAGLHAGMHMTKFASFFNKKAGCHKT